MNKETMGQKYTSMAEIKAQTDVLLTQLSKGEYSSLDVWANNLAQLKFSLFNSYMADTRFVSWLIGRDAVMVSEIAMTGRMLMAMQNFMRLAAKNRS